MPWSHSPLRFLFSIEFKNKKHELAGFANILISYDADFDLWHIFHDFRRIAPKKVSKFFSKLKVRVLATPGSFYQICLSKWDLAKPMMYPLQPIPANWSDEKTPEELVNLPHNGGFWFMIDHRRKTPGLN